MTNLTEQWKKGELPFGWYYIKIPATYSRSGVYFLVEFPQDKEQKPEYERTYSESFLSHLLIEKNRRKAMSKEHITPEVGDIIMYHGYLYNLKGHIHTIENEIVYSICKDGHKINVCADTIRDFYKRHDFLGKSKANINDLFKTENEE